MFEAAIQLSEAARGDGQAGGDGAEERVKLFAGGDQRAALRRYDPKPFARGKQARETRPALDFGSGSQLFASLSQTIPDGIDEVDGQASADEAKAARWGERHIQHE